MKLTNWLLLPLAIAAEALDALTIDWARESNPIVLFFGPWSYVAKVALIAFLALLVWKLKDQRVTALLGFAIAVSLFGAWTNVR